MVKGFKDFLLRGNVVDLAVAVVIGAAFTGIVAAFSAGILTPLIAAVFGQPNLDSVGTFTVNGAEFSIGVVLTAIINFVLVAAVIYFLVVTPMRKIAERSAKDEAAAPPADDIVLLTEIRDALRTSRG